VMTAGFGLPSRATAASGSGAFGIQASAMGMLGRAASMLPA
jgi:hypothetical protein